MRPSAKLLLALAALLVPLAAHAASWERHAYKEDHFSAEFMSGVKILTEPMQTTAEMPRGMIYGQDTDTLGLTIAATQFAPDTIVGFAHGVKNNLDRQKCERVTRDTRLTIAGVDEAREIHAENCSNGAFNFAGVFYRVGQNLYQVFYVIAPGADTTDGEHFLHSFKVE